MHCREFLFKTIQLSSLELLNLIMKDRGIRERKKETYTEVVRNRERERHAMRETKRRDKNMNTQNIYQFINIDIKRKNRKEHC